MRGYSVKICGKRHPWCSICNPGAKLVSKLGTIGANAKRSAALRGRSLSLAHRANVSASLRGRLLSSETRAKISAALTGRPKSAEHRAWLSAIHKDRRLSPEHCLAISAAHKGRSLSTNHRIGISEALIGRPKSAEHRAKIAAYARSPEARKRKAAERARYMAAYPSPETELEFILYCLLHAWNMEFLKQQRFGRYVVDAYVPSLKMAVEADGDYWHRDSEKESRRRDRYLERGYGISFVWHLTEGQLRILRKELL